MAKEMETSGSHGKQTDLNGQTVEESFVGSEDIGLVKSCLQKTIRRGKAEASCIGHYDWLRQILGHVGGDLA